MLEAIDICQQIAERELNWTLSDQNRTGDHRWWISDLRPFQHDHPGWELTYDVEAILREIHSHNAEAWLTTT
jgi:CDP-paratose 2-epimerase